MPGMSCVAPQAAFYAMPKVDLPPGDTDEEFILGLLRATGVLCVYGSGFGTPPEDGFFRVVFLASPGELERDLRRHRRASRASSSGPERRFCGALLPRLPRPAPRSIAGRARFRRNLRRFVPRPSSFF